MAEFKPVWELRYGAAIGEHKRPHIHIAMLRGAFLWLTIGWLYSSWTLRVARKLVDAVGVMFVRRSH